MVIRCERNENLVLWVAPCLKYCYLCKKKRNMLQETISLNEAQLSILRLLARMNTMEKVNELKQIISNYYAQKATEEMDRLWEEGIWSEEQNEAVLKEHLRTPYRDEK